MPEISGVEGNFIESEEKTVRRPIWLISYPLPQADADGEDAGRNESAPISPTDGPMPCPLCDRTFPVSEIQLHAMYCYGTGHDTTEDSPGLINIYSHLPLVSSQPVEE